MCGQRRLAWDGGCAGASELEDALAWHLHPDQMPSGGGLDASKELFDSLPLLEATHSHVHKPPPQQHQGFAAQAGREGGSMSGAGGAGMPINGAPNGGS
eukprot:scaffold10458_cov18-Tisochrysis_lutea.AAC.1